MTATADQPTFGEIEDRSLPLAVLVHGFPDTLHTWRHLGPQLAAAGYRVVAPWLPGYRTAGQRPITVGSYVRHILDVRTHYHGDERTLLVGHDWGANAGYGAVALERDGFDRFVALAVPPVAALGGGFLSYRQLKRSFYVYFIQRVGLAEAVLLGDGFWESLWADWSPGYDPAGDLAELRRHVTVDTIASVVNPYRASFDPAFADPAVESEALAAVGLPPVPTLYLHGQRDGAIGADLLGDVGQFLPAPGSGFEILDGVGHFLHLEEPQTVWERIGGWLAG